MPTSSGSDADLTAALADAVRAAAADRRALEIRGAGTRAGLGRPVAGERLEVAGHRGVVDYDPAELVLTARAGTPLTEIEALLAANGQMLAFEPPRLGPGGTLGGAVATGRSGLEEAPDRVGKLVSSRFVGDAQIPEFTFGASVRKTFQGQEVGEETREAATRQVREPRHQPLDLTPSAFGPGGPDGRIGQRQGPQGATEVQ